MAKTLEQLTEQERAIFDALPAPTNTIYLQSLRKPRETSRSPQFWEKEEKYWGSRFQDLDNLMTALRVELQFAEDKLAEVRDQIPHYDPQHERLPTEFAGFTVRKMRTKPEEACALCGKAGMHGHYEIGNTSYANVCQECREADSDKEPEEAAE